MDAVIYFAVARSISEELVIGIGFFLEKSVYGVINISGVGGLCPHIVKAVVINTGYNLISSSGVGIRKISAFGAFVGKDFDSQWSK